MVLSRLSLYKHIRRLKDPRLNRRKRHLLGDILTIAVCAVIAGANTWPQGNRTTKGNLGKMGKDASKVALSEIPGKQGVFEIRPYSRLIVFANVAFGDRSMSLEKCLENQGN
jgi:DDE_Tnp_1-associated